MRDDNEMRWQENRLLVSLPERDRSRLIPQLEILTLFAKETVHETGQEMNYVYFPLDCIVVLISSVEAKDTVEVGLIGNEGMVGLPLFLEADTTPDTAFSQVPGKAVRIKAEAFKEEVSRGGALHALLHRYTQALFTLVAQSAACNRVHAINERCARWLLVTHDRAGADQFSLTQEFLAEMLGVRRASVNAVARVLRKASLIQYSRGKITVIDRPGLEAASCECYGVIRTEFDRLFG